MTASTYADWRDVYDDLHAILIAAQVKRHQRQDWVGSELGWVRHEREVMTDRVNTLRARRGFGPLHIEAIAKKEQLACGHSDYTTKYAIGCADLVVQP